MQTHFVMRGLLWSPDDYPRKEALNGPPGGHFRAEEASPEN